MIQPTNRVHQYLQALRDAVLTPAVRRARVLAWRYLGVGNPNELTNFLVADSARAIQRLTLRPTLNKEKHIERQVARFVREIPIRCQKGFSSAIITGYARSGKSLLATELARGHGYHHIGLDLFTRLYYNIKDDELRLYTRKALLNGLLRHFREGLIIEGDDLISRNRSRQQGMLPFSLETLQALCGETDVLCYVVGNATASAEAKKEGFRRFRETGTCWTSKKTHWDDLETRAREYIDYNRQIYALANDAGIPFLEIDPTDFETSLSQIAHAIKREALQRRSR